jgi:hypothetical protein
LPLPLLFVLFISFNTFAENEADHVSPAPTQEILVQDTSQRVPSVEQRLEHLENTINQLRTNNTISTPTFESKFTPALPKQTFTGLGPAASKIYHQSGPTTWGLSSEFMSFAIRHGRDSTGSQNVNRLNVTSLSPTLGVRLHRRALFNSQILFENGGAEASNTVTLQKGQAVVTQAYVDWLADNRHEMGVRIGHQFVPIGWVNTLNESVTYHGVLKPELERELIPSTWHENGVSLWINRSRAEIQVGVFNSLDASGLRGETFLAGGRSHGQNAKAEDLMTVVRLHGKGKNLLVGSSVAAGQTSQGGDSYMHGTFNIVEAHSLLRFRGVELFGQWAMAQLKDADSISVVNSTAMGSKAEGYSLQLATTLWKSKQRVWVFARHSQYDLHKEVPINVTRNSSLNKTTNTLGLSYFPLPNWVVKADYAFKKSAGQNDDDEINVGTSISF